MKTYSRRRGVDSAFQLNKENLSKLQELVLTHFNDSETFKNSYGVELINDREISNLTLDELLNFSNIGTTEITSIKTSVLNDQREYFAIYFYNSPSQSKPIRYFIETNSEKDFVLFDEKINNFILSIKPKYSFISEHKTVFDFVLMFLLLILYVILVYWISTIFQLDIPYLISMTLSLFVGAVSGIISPKIISSLFPIGEFNIGEGLNRSQSRKNTRKFLLSAIVIPLILQLIGLIVGKYI